MANGLKSLNRVPFVPVIALLFGIVAGVLMLATPQWLFERGVAASGLPNLVSAAAPPLGEKARIMSAILAVFLVSGLVWLGLTPLRALLKPKLRAARGSRIDPVSRSPEVPPIFASPHPNAPARSPIFAERDLGAPFMSDEAIAHARDELILDAAWAEPVTDTPEPVTSTPEPVTSAPEPVAEWPEPVPAPLADTPEVWDVGAAPAWEKPVLEPVAPAPLDVGPLQWPVGNAASEWREQGEKDVQQPEPVVPDPVRPPLSVDQPIPTLLDRLEAALRSREARTGSTAPFPGDMSALRKALGSHR